MTTSLTMYATVLILAITLSSSSSSATTISADKILESARSFSSAVDEILEKSNKGASDAAAEAENVKELAPLIDAAFSAYFDLEMLIASKLNVLKDEAPETQPNGANSPKYFDNVKQFLKSVVGSDKKKSLPIKDLAAGASRLAKEAVDLSVFDNGLEGVMSRADAVFFILHDIEIRVNPNLEEYKKQLAAAYKKQVTSVVTDTKRRKKRSYDHGYDSGWHIAHHLGFWQALADSNSASNHGDPVSKSHAIFWAINQNLGPRWRRDTESVVPSRVRKARSPGWHHGFHDGHADGFDIGYHQGAAHAAIRQAAMELNGLGHLPLYGGHGHHGHGHAHGHGHHVWKRSPYYGYGGYHHYGHADPYSHLDHIMSHIHPDPHGYGPLHYHSNWW